MADEKVEPKTVAGSVAPQEELPAYHPLDPGPSSSGAPVQPSELSGAPPEQSVNGPTVASPFNFPPSDVPAPAYVESESAAPFERPIAIPQVNPYPASPLLSAHVPSLLGYGITHETWSSFLGTMSAFLTATVSDRAVSHAGDVARHIGSGPKNYGKSLMSHAKAIGQNITGSAKKGNFIDVAKGVVGGVISLPVSAAVGLIGTTASLPSSAMSAVALKPQTPRERATAYTVVANQDWFHVRGLHAQLLDTQELSQLIGVPPVQFLQIAHSSKDMTAAGQLDSLRGHIADLDINTREPLYLGQMTLWLVINKA